jgi:hypothetical protein
MNKSGEPLSSGVDSPVRTSVSRPGVVQAALAPAAVSANQTAIIYGFVAAAIIIALSPALFFSFGYHNDYNQWSYDSHTCCTQYPETNMLIDLGRYFGAFAQNLQSFTIHSLDDLWRWRLIGIFSTAVLAIYYLYIVSLRRPPTWQNACMSVAVFTLPTMQFQAIWVAMYVFWTPPILLSLAAAHSLVRATDRGILLKINDRYILPDRPALWRSARLMLLAYASVLAGCFFYPMSATFVVVPVAHLLLSGSKREFRQLAVLATAVLGGAFVGLFIVHKFIVLPRLSNVPYLGEYAYSFSGNLLSEAAWRLHTYLADGAYLWLGVEIPLFPILISVACIGASFFCAMRIYRRSIGVGELFNVLMACSLFIVVAAPLLVVQQFTTAVRVLFSLTAVEMLVVFWLLRQLPVGSLRLASLFAVLGVGCSFVDVYGTSAVAHAEHVLYARSVANLSPRDFHAIAILRPDRYRRVFGFPLRNEPGGLGPAATIFDLLIGPRYNGTSAIDVTTLVLPSGQNLSSAIESNDKTLPLGIEENAVVIDTSPLYGEPSFKNISSLAIVSARPRDVRRGIRYGPANAVDGLSNTFWELAEVPFPIALELNFPTAHTLVGYSLSTVEATERMPSSWEICVSADRINWRRLQQTTEGRPWKNEEIRHYKLAPTSGVAAIKLVVTATDDNLVLRLYEFRPEFATSAEAAAALETAHDVSGLRSDTCTKEAEDRVIPELLYAYKDYNVIRAGEFYIGVAQDLGQMDVDAVLANTAPRPPSEKFITARSTPDLEAAIDRYAKQADAEAPPELLYAYKGYNIVRAGEHYIAVAQELGPMDVRDVLKSVIARPPAQKFIIAHDTSSLEAAIDANVKDAGAVSR